MKNLNILFTILLLISSGTIYTEGENNTSESKSESWPEDTCKRLEDFIHWQLRGYDPEFFLPIAKHISARDLRKDVIRLESLSKLNDKCTHHNCYKNWNAVLKSSLEQVHAFLDPLEWEESIEREINRQLPDKTKEQEQKDK